MRCTRRRRVLRHQTGDLRGLVIDRLFWRRLYVHTMVPQVEKKKGKAALDAALNRRLAEQGGVISNACPTARGSSYGRSAFYPMSKPYPRPRVSGL